MMGSIETKLAKQPSPTPTSEARKFGSLAEIARLINSSSDLPAVLNRIVFAVCQHSSWGSCGIMGVNRKAQLSELVARFDPFLKQIPNPPTSWKLQESATMRVIETNRPVIIEDAQICDEFLSYKEDSRLRGYRTVVIMPLGSTDQLGREMTIAVHSRQVVTVSESELAFLVTVAQLASIAVEKAKRVQFEQDLAQRLRQTIEISSLLMERVLAEGSMDAVVEVVAAVVPHPLIIADFAAGTSSVRRCPVPKLMGELDWKRLVGGELAPQIVELVRSAATSGFRTSQPLIIERTAGTATLQPVVEPLRVHNQIVGGLLIFPTGDGLDDLDAMVAQAAKLALNVQLMRDYVRFRSEAGSLAEVFKTLFAGAPRHPGELLARAQRLGISLPGPARLITIGFPNDAWEASEPPNSGLHLSLARAVADLRPGAAAVIVDDDLIVFAPANPKEESAQWKRFVSRMLTTVESHAGARPIAAESRLCRRLSDYREARIECGRVMTLARMFGKTGPLSQADFGPFAVLLSAVDQPSARDFVRHMLGAIEDHDARNCGELLHTLTEFVRDGCRYQSCADRLGIHVSTLRYRLHRLQEQFGVDFEHPDSLFGLALALRLHELARKPKAHQD
jgi:purine catabolism regulator